MSLANYIVVPYWLVWAKWAGSYSQAYSMTIAMLPLIALFNAITACYVAPLALGLWKVVRRFVSV